MKPKANNYAFIDSQNLNLGIRSQGWRLDFARFRIYLKEKYSVSQAYRFIGFVPGNSDLYTKLQEYGYLLIFKPTLEINKDGKTVIKGNVDAELVLHAMIQYPNYEQAVIVTGDGDFYCLVDHLNKNGKLLKLLVPNVYKYSKLLRPFAVDKLDFMNNFKEKLGYKKTASNEAVNQNESQLHKDETL